MGTHGRRPSPPAEHDDGGGGHGGAAVAHGDAASSKVVGRRIEQLALPKSAMIGALVRRDPDGSSRVIMAHHDTVIYFHRLIHRRPERIRVQREVHDHFFRCSRDPAEIRIRRVRGSVVEQLEGLRLFHHGLGWLFRRGNASERS